MDIPLTKTESTHSILKTPEQENKMEVAICYKTYDNGGYVVSHVCADVVELTDEIIRIVSVVGKNEANTSRSRLKHSILISNHTPDSDTLL